MKNSMSESQLLIDNDKSGPTEECLDKIIKVDSVNNHTAEVQPSPFEHLTVAETERLILMKEMAAELLQCSEQTIDQLLFELPISALKQLNAASFNALIKNHQTKLLSGSSDVKIQPQTTIQRLSTVPDEEMKEAKVICPEFNQTVLVDVQCASLQSLKVLLCKVTTGTFCKQNQP